MLPTMPIPHKRSRMRVRGDQLGISAVAACALLYIYWRYQHPPSSSTNSPARSLLLDRTETAYQTGAVLISYGYYEKDRLQRSNFEFFLAAGTTPPVGQDMHWCFVISTEKCAPCKALQAELSAAVPGPPGIGVSTVQTNGQMTMLHRTENVGMDVALHNITLEYMAATKQLRLYKYYFFINSSTKGPFFPSYMPQNWHWTHAYLSRFQGDIHAVAASVVCLPEVDAGGPGPRLESWAYALDQDGLRAVTEYGALNIRSCKLCGDASGIVVGGEYGLTMALFQAGYNFATLMMKYKEGVDWRQRENWGCNNNVHASRHGTYAGIAQHPLETVFVKSSWHVGDPYTSRYGSWRLKHLNGEQGTEGTFDAAMYHYGISLEAQEPNLLEFGYNVTAYRNFFTKEGGASAAIAAGKARMRRARLGGRGF